MTHDSRPVIRPATRDDVPLVLGLIRELAEYERLLHEVTATEAEVQELLFGARPGGEAVIAEINGETAGYALFFHNCSTFLCKRGLYLEDLFVRPQFRSRGIGKLLLAHLARLALERGCARFEWAVLDWNESAIGFYRSIGAVPMSDWRVMRLTGAGLDRLAGV
jgi:GNAT superfamily N-acetyltransferase